MFLNVLKFENVMEVPLNVHSLMGVFFGDGSSGPTNCQ